MRKHSLSFRLVPKCFVTFVSPDARRESGKTLHGTTIQPDAVYCAKICALGQDSFMASTSFETLLDKLYFTATDQHDKGDKFERLMQGYFRTDPE